MYPGGVADRAEPIDDEARIVDDLLGSARRTKSIAPFMIIRFADEEIY